MKAVLGNYKTQFNRKSNSIKSGRNTRLFCFTVIQIFSLALLIVLDRWHIQALQAFLFSSYRTTLRFWGCRKAKNKLKNRRKKKNEKSSLFSSESRKIRYSQDDGSWIRSWRKLREMSVPFECELETQKSPNISAIMRKIGLTEKEEYTLRLIMGGMNPYMVSKYLGMSNHGIYNRVERARIKYIKTFGVPASCRLWFFENQ